MEDDLAEFERFMRPDESLKQMCLRKMLPVIKFGVPIVDEVR
jgi:hypothetical protein